VRVVELRLVLDDRRLEPDGRERPAAEPARLRARPLEERDQRSRPPDLVAEVEVVAVRIVEVDGLLDEREAEAVAVEVERLLRIRAHASHVVQPRQLHGAAVYAGYWRRRKSTIVFVKNRTATMIVRRVRLRSTMCVPPADCGVNPIPPMPVSRP